eukprot:gene15296-biopygen11220
MLNHRDPGPSAKPGSVMDDVAFSGTVVNLGMSVAVARHSGGDPPPPSAGRHSGGLPPPGPPTRGPTRHPAHAPPAAHTRRQPQHFSAAANARATPCVAPCAPAGPLIHPATLATCTALAALAALAVLAALTALAALAGGQQPCRSREVPLLEDAGNWRSCHSWVQFAGVRRSKLQAAGGLADRGRRQLEVLSPLHPLQPKKVCYVFALVSAS